MMRYTKVLLLLLGLSLALVDCSLTSKFNKFVLRGKDEKPAPASNSTTEPTVPEKHQPKETDIPDFNTMDEYTEMRFMFNITHHLWAGFVDGWYKNAKVKFTATDECFGGWIEDDFWELNSTFYKILELQILDITYDEFKKAAIDITELIFKQDEVCGFRRYIRDVTKYCEDPKAGNCDFDKALEHLQKHAFELITKVSSLIDVVKRTEEAKTFEAIYETMEIIGESLGSITGSLIDYK
eukprot:403373058